MIIDGNRLTPSEEYKYVTDGETFSTLVFLGKNASADDWHDTNDEPGEEDTEEVTLDDALEKLRELGVDV